MNPSGAQIAPLALSALAWVGCLATSAVLILAGFLKLWDSSLPLGRDVLDFRFLASTGFVALQTGLRCLLGVRAMAILGSLCLVVPAVAGQVPELLNAAYRVMLWSWTPFRFSVEGLRSLCRACPARRTSRPGPGCSPDCSRPGWCSRCGRAGQPSSRLKRTRRTGLSTLVSTRQTDCQVPSVITPPSTGIVAYGGNSAGRTWSRP